ncbi:MAG TPA: sulfatase, partial [Pontiella sp.]
MRKFQDLVMTYCFMLLAFAGPLRAEVVVNIDITSDASVYGPSSGGLAGVVGKAGGVTWNAVGDSALYSNLQDENGDISGVTFQLTGNQVFTSGENDLPDTFRITGAGTAGFFQSCAFLSSTGTPGNPDDSSFTIGGLEPSSSADLYFYATWEYNNAGSEFRVSSDGGASWTPWALADGTPSESDAPFLQGSSYVVFPNVMAHTDGTILGEWKTVLSGESVAHRGPFNAVQVVASPVPPASQQLGLGIDGVGDMFLQMSNLPAGEIVLVQETNDLVAGNWSNRFVLSGKVATELLIPAVVSNQFYRTTTTTNPPVAQPNVVLILAEDCSKHWYDMYDPVYGTATPNIESLGSSGLIFDNAYCCVAVCSAARSTLISGCNPVRYGIAWHRSAKDVSFSNGLQAFPAYLRSAGYYTSTSNKRDENVTYNTSATWDKILANNNVSYEWRNRPAPSMPFYHVQTIYSSHESSIQTFTDINSPVTDPDSINLYPVHPDTATFRKTYAKYHDIIQSVDRDVGRIVNALQADGLLADTFIIFVGDNAGTVAGSKGYITETGLHVPLVVYVPDNWKHLTPAIAGTRVSGFIGFEDLSATIMNLAGLGVPNEIDGKPFIGPGVTLSKLNANDEVFSSAERFDEGYNTIRSLRKGNFKYIRHYEPFYPYALYNKYRYVMEAQKEWKQMYDAGQLNAVQSRFFEPRQGEELYDLSADPFETTNLAGDPSYAATLSELRLGLYERVTGMPDLGILREATFLQENGGNDPVGYGQSNKLRIQRYFDIADLMLD